MNRSIFIFFILPACIFLLAGCGSPKIEGQAVQYQPTDIVETVFREDSVPDSCRVFAQLYATMPSGSTSAQFAEAVTEEAKSKGADIILIGRSRQCTTGNKLQFSYYGPGREYKIRDWPAWGYGYEKWQEQGAWISIGYQEWGSADIQFDYPVLTRVVFIRCR
jgi:hypothetical protein